MAKLITIFHEENCTSIPTKFESFKEFWMGIIEKIPTEFRDTTEIILTTSKLDVQVVFSKPETSEEAKEINQLKKLLKKYPNIKS